MFESDVAERNAVRIEAAKSSGDTDARAHQRIRERESNCRSLPTSGNS
jgi:hypothetical protein